MTSWTLFQNNFILRRARAANFADIIKNFTMFIKTTFKDLKKFKQSRNYALNCKLYLYFLTQQKLLISGKKMMTSAGLRVIYVFFGSSLGKV